MNGPIRSPLEEAVGKRVGAISAVLDAHAGGLEVGQIRSDGHVSVRFTGMCTGCPLRPVTFNGLVSPALRRMKGVTNVTAEGGRISAEAEERLMGQLSAFGTNCLLTLVETTAMEASSD